MQQQHYKRDKIRHWYGLDPKSFVFKNQYQVYKTVLTLETYSRHIGKWGVDSRCTWTVTITSTEDITICKTISLHFTKLVQSTELILSWNFTKAVVIVI